MQRIERDLQHVKADMQNLEEKCLKIEHIISDRTTTQRAERDDLANKRKNITDGIAQLLARIEALHQEENECDHRIGTIDKDITTLRYRYKADLQKIQSDRTKFQKVQAKLLIEQEETLKEYDIYNQKLEQIRNACEKEEKILGTIEKSISKSRENIKIYDQKIIESHEIRLAEEHHLEEEIEEENELKSLKQKLVDLSEYIKQLSSSILVIRNEIRAIEQYVTTANNTTLPNMESEKKLAVKIRDFRAAKDLQKSIAEVQLKLEEQNNLIHEKQDQLQKALWELDAQQNEYDKMESDIKLKTHEIDIEKLQKILSRIESIQILIQNSKKKPDFNQYQNMTLEIKLSIERAKVTYICLLYDIPAPQEKIIPPEAEHGETRDKPITEIKFAERKTKPKLSAEVLTESVNKGPVPNGLVIEKQPQEAFVPVAKNQNVSPGKILEKSMEDRIFEKKLKYNKLML